MSVFDHLTLEGKLSAIYEQVLDLHVKLNDTLARVAQLERLANPPQPPAPPAPMPENAS